LISPILHKADDYLFNIYVVHYLYTAIRVDAMSNKYAPNHSGINFNDKWIGESYVIDMEFKFDPNAPENEELLAYGTMQAHRYLPEHDCSENVCLEKCLVTSVDVISSGGTCDSPLSPLFFTLHLGSDRENPIASDIAGCNGKFPLALARQQGKMFRRKPDDEHIENARRDFGKLDDNAIAECVNPTVQQDGRIALPAALSPYVTECFARSHLTSLEGPRRAQEASQGVLLLQYAEYELCRNKIQDVLSTVRESFDDATTLWAELSIDSADRAIATQVCDQTYYVYVKMTVSC
jgi:hypothetical protein